MNKSNNKITIELDIRTVAKVTLLVIGLLLFLKLIDSLLPTLTLIGVAVFLSIALNPAVRKIAHMLPSKSRKIATGVAFFLVVGFLSLFFSITIPPVAKQISSFASDLPQTVENFRSQDNFLSRTVARYQLEDDISQAAKDIASRVSSSNDVVGAVNKLTTTVVRTVAVLIMTFMMLVEGPEWVRKGWALTDKKKLGRRQKLVKSMEEVVTGYVNGQLLISAIAASIALIFMLIIGTPDALAKAGIVAVFGLIPLIGSAISAAIIVLSTLLVNVKIALILAVYFLVYQQIENATIQPYIQGRRSSLTALTVFLAALIGASLAGLFGALVAVPVAGCSKVLLDDYLEQRKTSRA
ncbi:AI-2E family transporter [Candidatus Saccharibacteria bacterium]|nr:AI-2E family transporter [Candidatus Saccharibacteria bacterium]MCB9821491.1 AI-2E family transporter [Candidatus Nomurabacteria bacterium]